MLFVSVFLGATHDIAIALRLGQIAADPGLGLGVRPALWKAAIQMFEKHPLTGIGLGTWAEIFPHYESAPRLEMAFHQAHNDYLQLAAEVGILGLTPLICAILWLGHISRRIRRVSYDLRPFVLCLGIAIAVMLLHGLVDFPMHITANALLFTILLALAIRIVSQANSCAGQLKATASWPCLASRVTLAGSIYLLLVYLAASVQNVGYPIDIGQADSIKTANEIISKHPASAAVYMDRFVLSGGANRPAADIDDLRSAVWLDPTNPYDRDLYAVALEEEGAMQESLQELAVSAFNSPEIRSHFYLKLALLKRLRNDQREAVEEGFAEAVAANELGAISALAWLHEALGDFGAEAALFESAARACSVDDHRSQYYDLAGRAWIKAGRARDAENDFRQAASDSSGTQAYGDLLTAEVSEKESFASVNAVIESAAGQGANPAILWSVLASAYQSAGDHGSAEKALLYGLNLDPSYGMLMRTGEFYLTDQHFDRAAAMFQRAIEVSSESAAAYYYLGVSNEGAYEYFQPIKHTRELINLPPLSTGSNTTSLKEDWRWQVR